MEKLGPWPPRHNSDTLPQRRDPFQDELTRASTSARASDLSAGVFDGCLRVRLSFGINSEVLTKLREDGLGKLAACVSIY